MNWYDKYFRQQTHQTSERLGKQIHLLYHLQQALKLAANLQGGSTFDSHSEFKEHLTPTTFQCTCPGATVWTHTPKLKPTTPFCLTATKRQQQRDPFV